MKGNKLSQAGRLSRKPLLGCEEGEANYVKEHIKVKEHMGHSTTDHSDLHHHFTDFVHFWPKRPPSVSI